MKLRVQGMTILLCVAFLELVVFSGCWYSTATTQTPKVESQSQNNVFQLEANMPLLAGLLVIACVVILILVLSLVHYIREAREKQESVVGLYDQKWAVTGALRGLYHLGKMMKIALPISNTVMFVSVPSGSLPGRLQPGKRFTIGLQKG